MLWLSKKKLWTIVANIGTNMDHNLKFTFSSVDYNNLQKKQIIVNVKIIMFILKLVACKYIPSNGNITICALWGPF